MYVIFGTDRAVDGYRDPESDDPDLLRFRPLEGERIGSFETPPGDDWTIAEAFRNFLASMERHIADGERPTWIETDNDTLLALISDHFKADYAKVNRPKGWGRETGAHRFALPAGATQASLLGSYLALMMAVPTLMGMRLLLRTTAGRDFIIGVMASTSSTGTGAYAPANWIGLTATAIVANAADTTLAGEIPSGTLLRAPGAYSHVSGQASYTLSKTFTSDQTITLQACGIFNANFATGGTMVFEGLLSATAGLVSGDQSQVVETITL